MNHASLLLLAPILALAPYASCAAPAAPDPGALKAQVDAREKRAELLLDEIKATDSRIEDRIDSILKVLKSVGDSKDSKTKVVRMKEQTIDALQKNLQYFDQRRATMREEMRNPRLNLTEDEKRRAITKFDERIEKRVQQILEINKSLPTHKDYDRYKVTGSDWRGPTYVENEDFKQNQRLTSHSNSQRDEIVKGLRQSLDRLDRQNRTLRAQMAAATTDAQRKSYADEISRNDALIKARNTQLAETIQSVETPTRPMSGKEAQDMDAALRKSIESLRRDFTTLFQRYSSYLNERSSVNTARAALDASTKR